jgi:hypothetical protein
MRLRVALFSRSDAPVFGQVAVDDTWQTSTFVGLDLDSVMAAPVPPAIPFDEAPFVKKERGVADEVFVKKEKGADQVFSSHSLSSFTVCLSFCLPCLSVCLSVCLSASLFLCATFSRAVSSCSFSDQNLNSGQ